MPIPIHKLVSIPGNRYEFNVAANLLVEKVGGMTIEEITLDAWKIVPKILTMLLDERLHFYNRTSNHDDQIISEPENTQEMPIEVVAE